MTHKTINKPASPQHPDWATVYINKTQEGEVLAQLEKGVNDILDYVKKRTDEQLLYSYGEGKWTIKEVLVHLMDVERVFSYRGLTTARQDTSSILSFDHNAYVPNSAANQRSKESLIAEYKALRQATLLLFSNMTDDALDFIGEAGGQPCTAKAMVYMIAGHEHHHLQILKERYQQ